MLGQPKAGRLESQPYHLPCSFPFKCFQVGHPGTDLGCQLHQDRECQRASDIAHMQGNRVWKTRKRHRIQTEIHSGGCTVTVCVLVQIWMPKSGFISSV